MGAHRRILGAAVLAGLTALAAFQAGGRAAAAAQPWPKAPFGTPPSFSRDYPLPLYAIGRFVPLQELVDQEKIVEARRQSVPDHRAEAFATLQAFAPRGDVAPAQSVLAYGPVSVSPPPGPPPSVLPAPHAELRHPKPAPVRVTEHRARHPSLLPPPLEILPPPERRR